MKQDPRPYCYLRNGRVHFGPWRSRCKTVGPPRFKRPASFYLYLGRA
jgi:hypothetical protein